MEGIFNEIDDSQRQAVVVDRIVTKIAKSMSPPPPSPAIIVTPPADGSRVLIRAPASTKPGASVDEGQAQPKDSPMTPEADKHGLSWAEHYYSTPAGLLQLSLLEAELQQRSADGRAHWEEKRERNMRAYPQLFNTGGAETCTSGETSVARPKDMEELLTLKEFLEEDEWVWVESNPRDGVQKAKEVDDGWELVGRDEGDEDW
ncbi:MAG: hypothetical protein Q9195_000822 [Heterodermia aff. obscurata]